MEFVLLMIFLGVALGNDAPPVLNEELRIRIFGTNISTNLPTTEVVHIQLVNKDDIKPFRKRPPKILQYRTTINDEAITLSLRHNRHFIAPGCLMHHYAKNGTKTLAPCLRQSRHCYYTGRSMQHDDSWMAASVCGGLRGALVFGNTSLIISPLDDTDRLDLAYDTKHLIYKYQGDKQACSTDYPDGRVLYPQNSRRRRDTKRHYIEMGVVIDPTMVFFHGRDIDQYTATALNIASRLYANRKTGQDIALVVTSIHKIESYEDLQIERTKDANRLLNSFCEWKSRQQDASLKTDATLFLTKVDIAYKDNEGTTGLAIPSGMCSEKGNCALIEDTGPVMGYTIAHEVGHLLSMKHDGPKTTCGSSIMNAFGTSGSAASTWSNCSKAALEHFLSSDHASCLSNVPAGFDDGYSNYGNDLDPPLPGVIYTADQQCKYVFGPNASLCAYGPFAGELQAKYHVNNSCEQIFCQHYDGAMCFLLPFPLLDGTDINNTRTWCIDGEPMAMTSADRRPPIHGGWSEWSSEWSTCTRTCGGGVKIRRRKCNNPKPQFNGRLCPGSDVKALMCNFQKCVNTFKETQCSELDSLTFSKFPNMSFSFVPYLKSEGDASCKLQCEGHSPTTPNILFINNTLRRYADGTECRLGNNAPFTRCIDGKCREFGCDGHLDSGLMFDKCGRCNDTGSQCKTVKGTYKRNGTAHEYETVLALSKGSAGITINQTNGYCFLNVLIGGEFALNGSGYAKDGVYMSNGVRVQYTQYPEQIKILEPLPTAVQIQVYRKYDYQKYDNVTPDIEYQFNEITSTVPRLYSWSVFTTQCSKSCGSGVSVPDVNCWSLTGPVEDYHCQINEKPDEIPQTCNTHFCPPRWNTTKWSPCTVSCGNGTRTRTVECVQEKNGLSKVMPESQCSSSSRPVAMDACDMGKCPSVWKPGRWSQCSKTCGDGIRLRDVECFDYKNTSIRVPAYECDVDKKPTRLERCQMDPCRLDIVGANCTDINSDCAAYGSDICVGQYRTWAEKNCMKFCRICDACEDNVVCERNLRISGQTFCKLNPGWTRIYCRHGCNYCTACDDLFKSCDLYDRKYCTDPSYGPYMRQNCQRFCGFC